MADYMSTMKRGFSQKPLPKAPHNLKKGAVTLAAEAEQQITNIATLLENYPAATLRIYGQTDQKGGKPSTGRRTATERVIQEILEQNGIERSRISATYRETPAPPDGKRGGN